MYVYIYFVFLATPMNLFFARRSVLAHECRLLSDFRLRGPGWIEPHALEAPHCVLKRDT